MVYYIVSGLFLMFFWCPCIAINVNVLSPLSDMSPATSDCLEPYFSEFFLFFSNYRVCVDFSGSFYFFLIFFTMCTLSGQLACDHGRRPRQLDQYGC